jgi:hypothetical protein
MIFLLAAVAVTLTFLMFMTRNMMLGFPCFIFWALLGGDSYTLSLVTWDMYYFLFFAAMGMAIFCMIAAFALRKSDLDAKKKDHIESDKMIDEGKDTTLDNTPKESSQYFDEGGKGSGESRRSKELHARAEARRSGEPVKTKTNWGEFK